MNIMKSEIKKVYFVPYKYIWNIYIQNDTDRKKKYLKYLDNNKMWGEVDNSKRDTSNGP